MGKFNVAGLPGITGSIEDTGTSIINGSGAFRSFYSSGHWEGSVIENGTDSFDFDASRSSAIYGASDTVMPESVDVTMALYLGMTA